MATLFDIAPVGRNGRPRRRNPRIVAAERRARGTYAVEVDCAQDIAHRIIASPYASAASRHRAVAWLSRHGDPR